MYRYFSVKIGLLLILLGMVSCAEHLEDMSQGDTSLLKVRGVFLILLQLDQLPVREKVFQR